MAPRVEEAALLSESTEHNITFIVPYQPAICVQLVVEKKAEVFPGSRRCQQGPLSQTSQPLYVDSLHTIHIFHIRSTFARCEFEPFNIQEKKVHFDAAENVLGTRDSLVASEALRETVPYLLLGVTRLEYLWSDSFYWSGKSVGTERETSPPESLSLFTYPLTASRSLFCLATLSFIQQKNVDPIHRLSLEFLVLTEGFPPAGGCDGTHSLPSLAASRPSLPSPALPTPLHLGVSSHIT